MEWYAASGHYEYSDKPGTTSSVMIMDFFNCHSPAEAKGLMLEKLQRHAKVNKHPDPTNFLMLAIKVNDYAK